MKAKQTFILAGLLFHGLIQPVLALDKWFYQSTNLLVDENVEKLSTLWKRAADAGYTHVILADSKFGRMGTMPPRYFQNIERVKKIAGSLKIEVVPALFPIGYSNSLLGNDVNLVEGLPVKELPMIVQDGIARVDEREAPLLPGADFSDLGKWSWKDETVRADDGTALIRNGNGKNARLVQKLKLKPGGNTTSPCASKRKISGVSRKSKCFRKMPEVFLCNGPISG